MSRRGVRQYAPTKMCPFPLMERVSKRGEIKNFLPSPYTSHRGRGNKIWRRMAMRLYEGMYRLLSKKLWTNQKSTLY